LAIQNNIVKAKEEVTTQETVEVIDLTWLYSRRDIFLEGTEGFWFYVINS
jgi:hypothetical protein